MRDEEGACLHIFVALSTRCHNVYLEENNTFPFRFYHSHARTSIFFMPLQFAQLLRKSPLLFPPSIFFFLSYFFISSFFSLPLHPPSLHPPTHRRIACSSLARAPPDRDKCPAAVLGMSGRPVMGHVTRSPQSAKQRAARLAVGAIHQNCKVEAGRHLRRMLTGERSTWRAQLAAQLLGWWSGALFCLSSNLFSSSSARSLFVARRAQVENLLTCYDKRFIGSVHVSGERGGRGYNCSCSQRAGLGHRRQALTDAVVGRDDLALVRCTHVARRVTNQHRRALYCLSAFFTSTRFTNGRQAKRARKGEES